MSTGRIGSNDFTRGLRIVLAALLTAAAVLAVGAPASEAGPQGPAGKVSVAYKVTGPKKVTCTVKQPKAAQSRRLRWSLDRGGATISHGLSTPAALERLLDQLRPGNYRLHLAGQSSQPISIRPEGPGPSDHDKKGASL